MSDLRVPTIALDAEIRYFDERPLVGRIFIPTHSHRHDGPMRPDEWMNQGSFFFPFLTTDAKRPVILNKRYVVVLTVPAQHPEYGESEIPGVQRRIKVECGTLRLEGIVHVDMPENQSRLLDFANRTDPFLTLYDGDRRHMIQKNRITFISEVTED